MDYNWEYHTLLVAFLTANLLDVQKRESTKIILRASAVSFFEQLLCTFWNPVFRVKYVHNERQYIAILSNLSSSSPCYGPELAQGVF